MILDKKTFQKAMPPLKRRLQQEVVIVRLEVIRPMKTTKTRNPIKRMLPNRCFENQLKGTLPTQNSRLIRLFYFKSSLFAKHLKKFLLFKAHIGSPSNNNMIYNRNS